MEMKVMCACCGNKEVETVMAPHWKTGKLVKLYKATCSDEQCINTYKQIAEEIYKTQEADYEQH